MLQEAIDQIRSRVPSGMAGLAALLFALAAWLATGFYQVNPSEIGVVMRFGRVVTTTTPGLHWHLPWPIETVLKPPVTRVLKAEVGFRTLDPGPPARYRPVTEESRMLTRDGNIVELDFVVQYRIDDPVDYLFNVLDPIETLRHSAESAMREVIGHSTIDAALTEGRMEIQTAAHELLQQTLDTYGSGLKITTVKLQDVVPPGPVQDAFKDVINAEQDRQRMINQAEGFANDILPKARGSAAQLVNEAQGYAQALIKEAEGVTQRFTLLRDAYANAPEVTRKRLYLETMEAILPGVEKYILDNSSGGTNALPLLQLRQPPQRSAVEVTP
jgi:membrane protease subunit HflK